MQFVPPRFLACLGCATIKPPALCRMLPHHVHLLCYLCRCRRLLPGLPVCGHPLPPAAPGLQHRVSGAGTIHAPGAPAERASAADFLTARVMFVAAAVLCRYVKRFRARARLSGQFDYMLANLVRAGWGGCACACLTGRGKGMQRWRLIQWHVVCSSAAPPMTQPHQPDHRLSNPTPAPHLTHPT